MQKKILIIGNDINAVALATLLAKKHDVFMTPSSDFAKDFFNCLDIREDNVSEILEFVLETGIDMTIPVSELTLKTDIVEVFNRNNLNIFAPNFDAAILALDKAYAKKVLYKLRISTPRFGIFEKQNMVLDYIKNLKNPFVIKSDDSNSSVVFNSYKQAKNYVDFNYIDKNKKIIIEDYVYGIPFSFYVITDGYKALPIGSSLNYKQKLEGDGGQLTSGMGACSPNYKLSFEQEEFLMNSVIYPTLDFLEIEGSPYLGILGLNCIMENDGNISVLGYYPFVQNLDAYPILEMIQDDLYTLFKSCIIGVFSDEVDSINLKDKFSSTLVIHCNNKENNENIIDGIELLEDETFFAYSPKISKNKYLEFEATNGEVLFISTSAPSVTSAVKKLYNEVENINFKGKYIRKDICKLNIS